MTKSRGSRATKRVAFYLRVSTSEQTTTNQRRELHAVAKRHGCRWCGSSRTQRRTLWFSTSALRYSRCSERISPRSTVLVLTSP